MEENAAHFKSLVNNFMSSVMSSSSVSIRVKSEKKKNTLRSMKQNKIITFLHHSLDLPSPARKEKLQAAEASQNMRDVQVALSDFLTYPTRAISTQTITPEITTNLEIIGIISASLVYCYSTRQ